MRSGPILPNSGSLLRSGVAVSRIAQCRCRSKRQKGSRDSSCVSLGTRGSTAKDEGADPGVRSADQGMAPIQRDEHEARRSPRRQSSAGHGFADPKSFRSGRNFSAWIGMVPKQHSSGGKNRLGNISKQGDRYLRGLFVAGALSVIRYAKIHGTKHRPWLTALLARRPTKVAAIALANKIARMVWAMMAA